MSEVSTGSAPAAESSGQGESQPQGENTQQQAPKEESKAAAQAARLEKFSYVVDGQDVEEEIDLNNKEEVKKRLQLGAAAKKRMAEAKAAQAKAYQIIQNYDNNPEEMFRKLGPKGREIAEKFLVQSMQEEMMDPKDRELQMTKSELEKYKDQEKKEKEENEKRSQSQKETKIAQDFQKTIIDAAEKSGLPKSPALIRRMAKILHTNVDLGLDLDAHDLAQEVKKDLLSEIKSILGDSDGAQLLALFGDDVAKKIRKHDLQRLQDSHLKLNGGQKPPAFQEAPRAEQNSYLTPEQWKEQNAKRVGQSK